MFIIVVIALDPSAVSDLPDSSRPDDGWTQWQWQVFSVAYTAESARKSRGC